MRKEKYITEVKTEKGFTLILRIRHYDYYGERKEYKKRFYSHKYITPTDCMKDAIKHRDKMLKQLDTVGIIHSISKTVREVYEEKKLLFPFSYETERKHDIYFNLCIKQFEDMPIDSITAKDITMSLNYMISKSNDVINHCFAIWKQIIKCAIISDYISMDPTIKVIVPKSQKVMKPRNVVMDCSLEDVIKALKNNSGNEFNNKVISYALITMSYLGLRPSECFALNKKDVDLNKMQITINKAVGTSYKEKLVIKPTKNITSIRTLPIPNDLKEYLEEIIEFQPSNLLFARSDSKPFGSNSYTSIIKRACDKAQIEFRAYMLRHKFSTDLIKDNVDMRTIQELMGHKNSSMTLSYARSDDNTKRQALENRNKSHLL